MKIVKKRTIILIIVCISFGFYIGYRLFVAPEKSKETWVVPNLQEVSKKFITEETLVSQIHQKQELITLEIDMTEKVTLDNSWGNLEIFKKVQSINYVGTGTYVIDLSTLKTENVTIDNKDKKITVKSASPTIKAVTIKEEKTEYQTPDNGLLRFGEIKLTPEENQMLLRNVKDKMLKKMGEQEFLSQATTSSKNTLKGLIENIIQSETKNSYTIEIQFQ